MTDTIQFNEFYNIISNEKRSAEQVHHGIDPATEETLWPVPVASQQDLDEAVASARLAFTEWSARDHAARVQCLGALADKLEAHASELTTLLHRETGKPLEFAKGEILGGIATLRSHLAWSVPDEVQKDDHEVKVVIQHAPLGAVAGIVPWNFPFQLSIIKIAPALAVGCTLILKPSPFTPYTALKIGEIAAQVLPPGVLQILGGDDNLGPWMTQHPGIDKVSFTGSIATGKRVVAATSETLKKVNLELGGNDAAIVTADFDPAEAAAMVARSTFAHSGQICIATKRIYVHESVLDEFMGHFTAIVRGYKQGEGFCSPIQNRMQYEKVKSLYQYCKENGYQVAVGSCDRAWNDSEPGFYMEPAVILNPPDNSRVVQEEAFGPIVPVMSWKDEEDVVRRANDTLTGLGGTVFCRDQQRAWKLASSLTTGNVWVNSGLKMDPVALFGAQKQSGIGCALGPLGLKAFTTTRTITYWKDVAPIEKGQTKAGGLFG
ncbi:hypothetical protein VHEMI09078 [[Torrubiella] hemipterigena]|uniref:aldehyde dehydrogenase (NAD(+)) n=1 Tax=[Torrubiella] hemipterigena TaxID=1531966 RepID=A0A0A1TPD3_9HYPO|nr:hypothetical protein VHEMI09078 [[Torrubiella] hemipterigena]